MFGILQSQGKLNVNDKAPINAWKNDERKEITLNNLLQMNSGLEWEENYATISDVTKMLFVDADMTKPQIDKPFVGKPNETWNYASGTTNLLSGILRNQFSTQQDYLDFPYQTLIDKIGMHSMLIETDFSGHFVASSYGWATARDWAKFGLLYLHKGNWNGEQIFDSSWEAYVKQPTNSSNGRYGAHFWLNAGGYLPDVPKDVYSVNGFQGQRVYIFPSQDLIVARFGLETMDFNEFLSEVLSAVK
jgi:CubicO group peptidase (beta-lactamase class C family)